MLVAVAGVAIAAAAAAPAPARADFTTDQPSNFAKTQERRAEFDTPAYRALQAQIGARETAALNDTLARDPERNPRGNLCATHIEGCQGDARLYDWQERGYGRSIPVLFTAADGATLSGHVWATRAGPPRRPVIVIATGSVGSPEQFYWWAAQTLAKDGYVVLTFDVQGQGQSDTFGEDPDQMTHVPAEPEEASYTTSSYLDGIRNAIDFVASTPAHPYEPFASPVTGATHRAKQDRRARAGLDAAYNPLWAMVAAAHIGVAGHSTGAQTSEQVSRDPRVGAAVLWDDVDTSDTDVQVRPNEIAGPPRVPVLEFGADYGIPAVPYSSPPDPSGRTTISRAYSHAGIDSMAVNIRGGSHLEWSYIADDALSATLRGMDMSAWYTQAWFDKYLKHDRGADSRLLTNRWLGDAGEAAVDPNHDGDLFSTYYLSRFDFHAGARGRVVCEDLRSTQCSPLLRADGLPANYSYLRQALTPDSPTSGGGSGKPSAGPPCRRVVRFRFARRRHVERITVRVNGRTVKVVTGRSIRRVSVRLPASGTAVVRLRIKARGARTKFLVRRYRGCAAVR
ncbi:MAG: hypothetical protein QOD76_1052 [Solirubrobacteraceae bacterium]|nr:hypothetical protein [Solirubrobacteraceae bacterium]